MMMMMMMMMMYLWRFSVDSDLHSSALMTLTRSGIQQERHTRAWFLLAAADIVSAPFQHTPASSGCPCRHRLVDNDVIAAVFVRLVAAVGTDLAQVSHVHHQCPNVRHLGLQTTQWTNWETKWNNLADHFIAVISIC